MRTATAAVEGNDEFVLTKAQSTRLRGGGGRGDHGEATSEMAGAFLQWRARTATVMLDQQWRTALAQRCERREMRKWSGDSVGQALGGFMTRPARQDVHGVWQRIQAIVDGWQHASDVF